MPTTVSTRPAAATCAPLQKFPEIFPSGIPGRGPTVRMRPLRYAGGSGGGGGDVQACPRRGHAGMHERT